MENPENTGRRGEILAKEHLERKGYKILHQNWRAGQKEVDLIAEKNGLLVFVEVKTRAYAGVLEPARAVGRSKQKLILSAATVYMERFKCDNEVRFDIITILTGKNNIEINHIEDAYKAYA